MAKKTRPSFDAPKRANTGNAGWVYRSGEDAADPQPPAEQPPVSQALVRQAPAAPRPPAADHTSRHPLDRALMPLTLLLMTALAPVSWLRGKR